MTPTALAVLAERAVKLRAEGQRAGQAAYNALWEVDAVLADRIAGTLSDPYVDDDVLPLFWLAVTEAALEVPEDAL